MSAFERWKGQSYKRKTKFLQIAWYIKYRVISWIENILIRMADPTALDPPSNGEFVTISLTSYPGRIHQVSNAIKSIMLQTLRPNRVVLWLAEEQFPEHRIPQSLELLKSCGLEVIFCPEDLKSHKKYYYALQSQQPNELVITIDDDIIYHPKTIERVVSKHKTYPNAVICNAAHVVAFDETRTPLSYAKWSGAEDRGDYSGKIMTPLTGSGCLYPYGIFPRITFDKHLIKANAFTADDLWIAAMISINNIDLKTTDIVARTFTTVSESQVTHLGQINCVEHGNDNVISNLRKIFPQFLSH